MPVSKKESHQATYQLKAFYGLEKDDLVTIEYAGHTLRGHVERATAIGSPWVKLLKPLQLQNYPKIKSVHCCRSMIIKKG